MPVSPSVSPISALYYFGTFNPFHQGHAAIVNAAIQAYPNLFLTVIPTGQPPHRNDVLSSAIHRLQMAGLALQALPQVTVLDVECFTPGPHYTAETLRHLTGENPAGRAGLLMGQDTLAQLSDWFDYAWLKQHTVGIVLARQSVSVTAGSNSPADYEFTWLPAPLHPASSTAIRNAFSNHQPVPQDWLHSGVLAYIRKNNLYTQDLYH